jgi:hypothetical protein
MIEYDVYKNVLQRTGWTLPRPFLYIYFAKKKKCNRAECFSAEMQWKFLSVTVTNSLQHSYSSEADS